LIACRPITVNIAVVVRVRVKSMSELDKYIISSKPGENPGKCIAILSGVGVYYSENALTVTDDSPGSKPLPTEDGILSTG